MESDTHIHFKYIKFLQDPNHYENGIPNTKQIKFLLTYLGIQFITGYKIIQILNPTIILLSQMQLNSHSRNNSTFSTFQIVWLESELLSERPEQRHSTYQRIQQVVEFLQNSVDIVIVYLNSFKLSKVSQEQLANGMAPKTMSFYKNNLFPKTYNSYRRSDGKKEGDRFHKLLQVMIKGCGHFQNEKYLRDQVLSDYRFHYLPDHVYWTASYIIGRQVVLHGYSNISSEKWMRRSTVKRFRRYDLTLRNQDQVCVIDWKFSVMTAQEVMSKQKCKATNKAYYQLAKMQYKTDDVKLVYISFDQKRLWNYHMFTQNQYEHSIENIQIDKESDNSIERIEIDKDSEQSQKIESLSDDEIEEVLKQDEKTNTKFQIKKSINNEKKDEKKEEKEILQISRSNFSNNITIKNGVKQKQKTQKSHKLTKTTISTDKQVYIIEDELIQIVEIDD